MPSLIPAGSVTIRGLAFVYFAIAVACSLIAASSVDAAGSEVLFHIEPPFADLGRLCLAGGIESDVNPGRTVIHIESSEEWQLEVTMPDLVRRVRDGESLLKTARDRQGLSPLEQILGMRPCVLTAGPGSITRTELVVDWHRIARALEQVLDPAVPPGTYQAVLLARLIGGGGSVLTEAVRVTVQFEITGWVELPADLLQIEIPTDYRGTGLLESQSASVLVAGNTAWELAVAQTVELVSLDGEETLPRASLEVCVPPSGIGYLPVGSESVEIARGTPSTTGSGVMEEIPIVFRLESDGPLPAGRYQATLVFKVRAQEPLP